MKNIKEWNDEYGSYHKNRINKIIHWICIPLIIFSLFGILSLSKYVLEIFIILTLSYYLRLSKSLTIGMAIISLLFIWITNFVNANGLGLYFYLVIFIVAWIGQFIGHKFEGKKPAFVKDLQFLLIGPLWLLSYIYNKINIRL